MSRGRTLDDLAIRCGCDKQRGKEGHGYVRYYESLFEEFRDEPVKILEIGVARGCSHWMWARYFENGHIYGVDNEEYFKGEDYQKHRDKDTPADQAPITFIKADQSYSEQMKEVATKYGPFDVIIDDGSHVPHHQIMSFNLLWPHCKRYYSIEDMHPGYKDARHETVDYFSRHVLGDLNRYGESRHADVEFNPSHNDVEWVLFPANMILVKRRQEGKYGL